MSDIGNANPVDPTLADPVKLDTLEQIRVELRVISYELNALGNLNLDLDSLRSDLAAT